MTWALIAHIPAFISLPEMPVFPFGIAAIPNEVYAVTGLKLKAQSPLQPLMNIEFNRLPPDRESVMVAYADSSGITVHGNAQTRFMYVVTNQVRDGVARNGGWNPAALPKGDYLIRIAAADYAGNQAQDRRELAITIE